jgi:hypothetical protein
MNGGPAEKIERKIFMPRNNGDFNYLGLIIGPRGATQKMLEADSGYHRALSTALFATPCSFSARLFTLSSTQSQDCRPGQGLATR